VARLGVLDHRGGRSRGLGIDILLDDDINVLTHGIVLERGKDSVLADICDLDVVLRELLLARALQ